MSTWPSHRELVTPRRSPGDRRRAVTFLEIMFATAILAFAMIPIFGLMTSGMVRTDVNVGFTNAVEIATGAMNKILSEETAFSLLPVSAAPVRYPRRGEALTLALGNVANDGFFDVFFPAPTWSVVDGSRTVSVNGITYHLMIWIGVYAADALEFGYYRKPVINFHLDNPGEFDVLATIDTGDWARGYSPYHPRSVDCFDPTTNPDSRVVASPYGRDQEVATIDEYLEAANANFAKVVVRVSWGEDNRSGRGREKDFLLVSFKADLQQ